MHHLHTVPRLGAVLMAATTALVATAAPSPATAARSLVYGADVDGDGVVDRVQIAPSSDLRVTAGWGTGHFTVRVTLANGRVATRLLGVSDYFRGRGRWTPWFGHAQIDHYRGQELLLGRTSGAHTQVYTVVTMRSGRLRVLDTPAGTAGWVVNSSWGTGAQGWACTNRGVMSRSAVPSSDHARFRIRRESFVLRLAWHRTSVMASTVAATSNGGMPTSVAHYGAFACRGLPQ